MFLAALFEEEQHQKWESAEDGKSELIVNSLKPTYARDFSLSHNESAALAGIQPR